MNLIMLNGRKCLNLKSPSPKSPLSVKNTEMQSIEFDELFHIFQFLPIENKLSFALVCQKFEDVFLQWRERIYLIIHKQIGFDFIFLCKLSALNHKLRNLVNEIFQWNSSKDKYLVRWMHQHRKLCSNPQGKQKDVNVFATFFEDVGFGIQNSALNEFNVFSAFGQSLRVVVEGLHQLARYEYYFRLKNYNCKEVIFILGAKFLVLDVNDPSRPTIRLIPQICQITDIDTFDSVYATSDKLIHFNNNIDKIIYIKISDFETKKLQTTYYRPPPQTKILFCGPFIVLFGHRHTFVVNVLKNFEEIVIPGLIVGGEFFEISLSKYHPEDNIIFIYSRKEMFVYKIQLPNNHQQSASFSLYFTTFALYNNITKQIESFPLPKFLNPCSFIENTTVLLTIN